MPEPKGNDVQRTLAVRVSPDYHAQLPMVAQVDEMSLTDLMMTALDQHMASRRDDGQVILAHTLDAKPAARWRAVAHSAGPVPSWP